ncbi:MAG TPA: cell division protein FtsX [Flavobacteriales bacterium]|nr:cell division protein FtsX [Flavobacteriales bacterium]|tara:strand:+ start:7756 stop:8631 length:876 start_codon:yes stop_codon:yes gene_type:complete
MSTGYEKYARRKAKTSSVSTVISISLVLFTLGLIGIILLNAKLLSDHVKENIGFSIILKPEVKEVEFKQIQKSLDAEPFVRETIFVDPDSAALQLEKDLGEDFLDFLGYNPLLPTIDIKLNPEYAKTDSLANIEKQLLENKYIKEVYYRKDLVAAINENVKKITFILLGLASLLLLISIAMINNSIRLAIYAQRFIIKTMQLVGATPSFIRRPFIRKAVLNGFISSILALAMLTGVLYWIKQEIPEIINHQNIELYAFLYIFIIIIGVFISYISTYFAVRKYLRIQTNELY